MTNDLTPALSQVDMVVLAVFRLGGDQHAIDTEDIAIEVNQIAPGRFTWRKYPEQVNLELVRVYLSAAKGPQNGRLLQGSGRSGWSLSSQGLAWAKANAGRLSRKAADRTRAQRHSGSIDETRWRTEWTRIRSTEAWARWNQDSAAISRKEASEVFRIDQYAVGRIRDIKIARLRAMFEDDPEMKPFIEAMAGLIEKGEE
jgi:hypothetical protein